MTETQAKGFVTVLGSAGVGCHVEQTVKNHNGWSVMVAGKVRLTQVEEAQRYVNTVGDRKKAGA